MARSLSEAQRAALARGRAKRAANVASGAKSSKPRASKASSSKASKSSKPRASKSSKPRASGLVARVAALESRVENHGAVLSDLVGIVEQHGARISAVEAAFGMGSAQGRGARTVMMPAMGSN